MTVVNTISIAIASALCVATILLLASGEPARALFVGLAAIVTSALGDAATDAA